MPLALQAQISHGGGLNLVVSAKGGIRYRRGRGERVHNGVVFALTKQHPFTARRADGIATLDLINPRKANAEFTR